MNRGNIARVDLAEATAYRRQPAPGIAALRGRGSVACHKNRGNTDREGPWPQRPRFCKARTHSLGPHRFARETAAPLPGGRRQRGSLLPRKSESGCELENRI